MLMLYKLFRRINYLLAGLKPIGKHKPAQVAEPVRSAESGSEYILFTSLYNENNQQRIEELLYCLDRNLSHPLIEKVFVVYDTSRDGSKNYILEAIKGKANVIVYKFNGRPRFSDLFALANRRYQNRRIILANSDIYFDQTLSRIDFLQFPDVFYVLSRRNADISRQGGTLIRNNSHLPNFLSADAWIFSTPLPPVTYADYELGTMYSDSFLNTQLIKSFPHVINPCLDVNAFHLQQELSESQAIDDNKQKRFAKIYELERKRSRDAELSSGIHWTKLPMNADELEFNYKSYWTKKNLLIDLRNQLPESGSEAIKALEQFAVRHKVSVWLMTDDYDAWSHIVFPLRGNYLNLTTTFNYNHFTRVTDTDNLAEFLEKHTNVSCAINQLERLIESRGNIPVEINADAANKNHIPLAVPAIYIDVQFGLSNRLRALASAYILARYTGRKLIMIWQPDVHCDCSFDDLFVNHNVEVVDSNVFEISRMDCYDYMNGPLRRESKLGIRHETSRDIYIKSAYTLDYKFYNKDQEDEFLRSLRPIDIVEQTLKKYELSEMIGMHVRMGGGENFDLDRWDSDEYLDATGKELMYYWRDKSHFKTFIPLVEKILEKNPAQRFFLAADMQLVYDVFRERFSENIAYYPRTIYDRSREQQITALIDLHCLSQTRMIYGSNWSSFTEVAARLGNKELKLSGVHF